MAVVPSIRIRVQTRPKVRIRVTPALIPANATVAVGTVTTLPFGSPATVTNVGTPSAVILDFGLPRGNAGVAGVVQSVVAGANVAVNSADPANPIVSAVGDMVLGSTQVVTGIKIFTPNTFFIAGATSGNTSVNAAAIASGTITIPSATDTLVGKATIDTLTNKTFDTAGAGNSLSIAGLAVTSNTGTGAVARAGSPTFTTQITTPKAIGGTGTGSSLSLQSTSGVGATDFINFLVGNNGAIEAARFDTSGHFLLGSATSISMNIIGSLPRVQVHGVDTDTTTIAQTRWQNTSTGVQHYLNHSKGAAIGTHALLSDGDGVGSWISAASDGVKFIDAASIQVVADGTQALDNTPGAINFRTNSGTTATTVKARLAALGQFLLGHVASVAVGATSNQIPTLQIHGLSTDAQMAVYRWAASTGGATISLAKSRGATLGTRGIVSSGDTVGTIQAYGDDGANFPPAGFLRFEIDGTPGAGDMPGRIILGTTPDGTASSVERLRVDNAGALVHRNNAQVIIDANSHHQYRTYTIATLPSAATAAQQIWCSDLGGGGGALESDGTVWKRLTHGGQETLATDADFTLTTLTSGEDRKHTGTLTANRAVTLSTTAAYKGARFRVTRTGSGAFTLTVAGKALSTNQWAEAEYDGSAWYLAAFGSL